MINFRLEKEISMHYAHKPFTPAKIPFAVSVAAVFP